VLSNHKDNAIDYKQDEQKTKSFHKTYQKINVASDDTNWFIRVWLLKTAII